MAAQPQPVTDARRRVIEQARSLLGAPYKYGGTSPAGFDCTGFVQYVFNQAVAVALPRRSAEQIGVGEAVSPLEMQPGDLVYFNIDKEDSLHIGIYVGQGRFIHAPSTKGVVNVQSLGLAYWRTQFLGARRLVL
jgi:cell wall-associated NlpC family hydrolase